MLLTIESEILRSLMEMHTKIVKELFEEYDLIDIDDFPSLFEEKWIDLVWRN